MILFLWGATHEPFEYFIGPLYLSHVGNSFLYFSFLVEQREIQEQKELVNMTQLYFLKHISGSVLENAKSKIINFFILVRAESERKSPLKSSSRAAISLFLVFARKRKMRE